MSYVELLSARDDTWMARRDPRLKLAWLITVSLAAILIDSTGGLVTLFVASLLVSVNVGWTPRVWLIVTGILLAVAWGTMLSQAMFYPANPDIPPLVTLIRPFTIGPVDFPGVQLHWQGAVYGLVQSLRMNAMMLAGLSVCLSTGPERLLAALIWLRVPTAVGFMAVAALRFLPTMVDQWATVRRSCQLRGYRPHLASFGRGAWQSWKIEAALLVPVVAAALRRAGVLATSLTARGFDATMPRTRYPALQMTRLEACLVALLIGLAVSLSTVKSLYWLATGGFYDSAALAPLCDFARQWL
jgi:energy-coupling factor transport system permease protein